MNRDQSSGLKQHVCMLVLCIMALIAYVPRTDALTIIREFRGGTPGTNNVGSGNLEAIFNAAADIWENAIQDDHTLVLSYGWWPIGGAQHWLIAQGGSPWREIEGMILFNNDDVPGHFAWFLDPTPTLNEEFSYYREAAQDLGAGVINVTRVYRYRTVYPTATDKADLLTIALHEIGHSLGMSSGFINYTDETADGDIDVTSPRPFAGMVIPMVPTAAHIHYDLAAFPLMAGSSALDRVMPSALDIVAMAQLSGFTHVNLNLSPGLGFNRSAGMVNVSWFQRIPGFTLEQRANFAAALWLPATQPVFTTNGAYQIVVNATNSAAFWRLQRTNDFALEVSAIAQTPPDVNPGVDGVQAYPGSTVQYSVSTRQPAGTSLLWYWTYSVNGGATVALPLGTGPVSPVSYSYGSAEGGNVYLWTLNAFISDQISATARLTVTVDP